MRDEMKALCAIGPAVCVCWLCCVGQAGEGV